MAQRLSDIPETVVRLSDVPEGKRDPLAEKMAKIDADRKAADAAEPGAGAYLLDRFKRGVAGFMGLPGDYADLTINPHPAITPLGYLIRKGLEKTGLVSEQRTPTEKVIATSKLYKDTFTDNLKTRDDALRYAGGVVEMAGAGGPMIAAKGVQAIPLLLSTTGAGLGMEGGGDIAEGIGLDRQAGEAVGAFAGGVVPALSGGAGQAGISFLKRRFSPEAQRGAAEATVANELFPLTTAPAAQANLDRSLVISDEFARSGQSFTPSLPARTGSPGLLAIEKDLVTRNPQALNKAVDNVARNEREIADFVNARFPAARETSVSRIAKLQRTAMDKLESMRVAIDDKLDAVAAVFERNPNSYEAGQKVRDLVFRQKEVYRGMSNQKYGQVYEAADRLGVRADVSDVAQYADDVLKSEFTAYQQSEIPPVFRQLAQRAGKDLPEGAGEFIAAQGGKKPGDVSFAELHSLLKRTNSDLASLRGSQSADRGMKEHLLGQLKTRLEGKLAAFEDAGFGEVATKLQEANAFYRNEYLPRFRQGFGADVLQQNAAGEFRVPNHQVVKLITNTRNVQAAKDFKALFDDSPEAWQALRDGYMDTLAVDKQLLGANGRVDQGKLTRFLNQNKETLAEFPQIRNELNQLRLDNGALLERMGRVEAAKKELAAASLYKLFNGKDPAAVVPEAITNPNAMRVLVHRARNTPQEGQALARAIAEDIRKQSNPVKYFNDNRESIEAGLSALGKDHFKNLETAIEAMTINRRSDLPNFVQQSGIAPDPIAAATGSSARAMVAHYINVARGRTGINQEATAFLGRWFDKLRADHKTVAMEAVFYDKDAARAIAMLAKQPQNPKFRADFSNAMATLGIRAEIAGQE